MRRILVVTWLELWHGREILRGVFDYMRDHGVRWRLVSVPLEKAGGRLPKEPPADGAIVATVSDEFRRFVAERTDKVVNVVVHEFGSQWPTVRPDDHACGRMAAEHLLGLGFLHFAFAANPSYPDAMGKLRGYVRRLTEAGHGTIWIRRSVYEAVPDDLRALTRPFHHVSDLPAPTVLFAANCYAGQQFISDCEEADLRVPQDIAVLAADEDEFLAHTTYPPLSTIDINSRRVGYEAGRALASLLRGEQLDVPVRLIPPRRVISRQSTDVVAVDDPLLARAMRHIQDHYDDAINVDDVVHAAKTNRRALERRFKATFGRTPRQMIQDVRLKEVRRLLATSSISIEQIAHVTGFCSSAHLSHVFRKATGMTPGKFRKTKG